MMKFSIVVLAPLAAWVLKKARRDYETRGQLSAKASTAGWILYLTLNYRRHRATFDEGVTSP